MNVFPQRVVEVHIKKNLEMRILVLAMNFMTVSAMVVVVDGVLTFISKVVDGVLIFVISVEEDMDVVVMCILMMKIQVLGMDFMMISEVMVVGVLVTMIGVLEEIAEMVVCSL